MRTRISSLLALLLAAAMLLGCTASASAETEVLVALSDEAVTVNGEKASESPDSDVFLSHDIIYYEDKTHYESGYPYGEGTAEDRHSADEAAAHTVVNITAPGTYRLSGVMSAAQIRIDLGEEAKTDPSAVVTVILDGVDITCTVAPALLFLNVYECDNAWTVEAATSEVDTSAAGANVIVADDSVNVLNGAYVARIYKDKEGEKKLWKQDGALYSYMSMNVDGEAAGSGVLTINAENEGLDTELHLTINGGHINIFSGDDGINTNEDNVSVTTINGGNIHIIAGLGAEGDGVDSNGWLVINGGTVIASANPMADAGLDSDKGSFVNGGTVVALGSTMDWAESDSEQITMNLQFAAYNNSDDAIVITDQSGRCVFAYDPSDDEVVGSNIRRYMGAVVSSPSFELNRIYHVYIGGELTGSELEGVYDPQSVTSYEGGVQQAYTGTDVSRFPGGFGGGRGGSFGGRADWRGNRGNAGQQQGGSEGERTQRPEGGFEGQFPAMPEGEMPQMPEGFEGQFPAMPEGEMPQMPEGFEGQFPAMPEGEMPQMPEGFEGQFPAMPEGEMPQMPEGFEGQFPAMPEGEMPEGGMAQAPDLTEGPSTQFYTQDKVNAYSGLSGV